MNRRSLRFGAITSLVVTTVVAVLVVVIGRSSQTQATQGVVELEPLTPFGGEVALGVGVVLLAAVLVLVVAALVHAWWTSRRTD